jgi:hypothetical protein
LSKQRVALDVVLEQLRLVGFSSLDEDVENNPSAARNLRRILRHFSKSSFRQLFDVPAEMASLVEHGAKTLGPSKQSNVHQVVQFFADESAPSDLLAALSISYSSELFQPDLVAIVRKVVTRGSSLENELSASLLKVKRARQRLGLIAQDRGDVDSNDVMNDAAASASGVWAGMAGGLVTIDK